MATCKSCGKRMVWGTTADGKAIPLDPTPAVYRVIRHDASGAAIVELVPLDGDGERAYMCSHFVTCPDASKFSHGRKP